MHVANYIMTFARTSGKDGDSSGITVFLVPASDPGVKIEEYLWTFNMPTDHPRVSLTNIWVSDEAIWGVEGQGLRLGQSFVHQNRIRQAASSAGGCVVFCVEESAQVRPDPQAVRQAALRQPGHPVAVGRASPPSARMLAALDPQDRLGDGQHAPQGGVERQISDKVSMWNYWSNRLVCEAADQAMQAKRRHRLFAAKAVRTHLPSPSPL